MYKAFFFLALFFFPLMDVWADAHTPGAWLQSHRHRCFIMESYDVMTRREREGLPITHSG